MATGLISTIAGNGTYGYSGDGGPAASATLALPDGLGTDAAGDIYFVDSGNRRVRRIEMFTSCAAEGFIGSRLTMCRQVCEVDQSSTRLLGLIRIYTTLYRSEPPCSR